MHIRVQVVKRGRRRKRNTERNFDNFPKNDMILREFKNMTSKAKKIYSGISILTRFHKKL